MSHRMALVDRTGAALAGTVLCPQHDTESNRTAVVEGVHLHRAYWTWAEVPTDHFCGLCGRSAPTPPPS